MTLPPLPLPAAANTALRKTRIAITIQGVQPGAQAVDVSAVVAADLLTFEVERVMGDSDEVETEDKHKHKKHSLKNSKTKANSFKLVLQDKTGKWLGPYMPPQGARVTITLYATNWDFQGEQFIDCGTFYVHSVNYRIAGRQITISGKSTPVKKGLQYQKNSQAWEGGNLKVIAQQIASANGFQCSYLSAENPSYDRSEQRRNTDLGHLKELCSNQGISMAIHNDTIVIFDEETVEAVASKGIITTTDLIDGSLNWQSNDVYGSCTVSYHDPDSGKVGSATFTPANAPASDAVLKHNERLDYKRALEQGISQNPVA